MDSDVSVVDSDVSDVPVVDSDVSDVGSDVTVVLSDVPVVDSATSLNCLKEDFILLTLLGSDWQDLSLCMRG